jgi:hypothetical protein
MEAVFLKLAVPGHFIGPGISVVDFMGSGIPVLAPGLRKFLNF